MLNYKEIKKELLKNENILKVSISSRTKEIFIKPVEKKGLNMIGITCQYPIKCKNYKAVYEIGGRDFILSTYAETDKKIIFLSLKEV